MSAGPVLLQTLGNGVLLGTSSGATLPLNGHQVYVYQRGTTTQVNVYSDSALTQVMSQPLSTGSWIIPSSGQTTATPGSIPGYVAGEQEIDFYDATTSVRVPAEPVAAGDVTGGGFSNPMTGVGDLIVGGASGAATRLAAGGSSGLVLTANAPGSAPTWQTPSGTFSGEVKASDFAPTGLTGATATGRYVGTTTSGAPASGTFAKGDWATDQAGVRWTCTTAGSPGTWTQEPGTGGGMVSLVALGADPTGTTDSSAAFQAALKIPGAIVVPGQSGATFKITAAVSAYTDATHNAQGQVWLMWGATITTTITNDSIIKDRVQDGTSFRSTFEVRGGKWVGSGVSTWGGGSQIYMCAFTLNQWRDVKIVGGDYSSFQASAGVFRACGRVEIAFTTMHDICATNGYNGWNFSDSVNGNTVTGLALEGQFILTGNYAYDGATSIPTAPYAWIAQAGNYTAYDVVCSFNLAYFTGFSGIFNEVGAWVYRTDTATVTNGSATVTDSSIQAGDLGRAVSGTGIPTGTFVGTVTAGTSFLLSSSPTSQVNVNATANGTSVNLYGESVLARVLMSDCIFVNRSTGANTGCVYFEDDGTNPYSLDPYKLDLHKISNCLLVSASNSTANSGNGVIHTLCSRSSVANTTIVATGTNGRCVYCRPADAGDATQYADLTFDNVECFQTNTAALSRMVDISPRAGSSNTSSLTRFRWTGGRLVSSITAQATVNTADGFFFGPGVSNWAIENTHLENIGNNGINVNGVTSDYRLRNVTIHNPNACNNAGSSAGNGIIFGGINTGTVNEITNVSIYDDRGTHQMYQGVQWGATSTTKATIRGLTIRGGLNAPMNSVTNGIASISGYEGDFGSLFNGSTVSISANPTSVGPYAFDAMVIITTLGGANGWTYTGANGRGNTSLGTPIAGGSCYMRRGESISIAGTTTGVATVIPMP